MQLCIRDLCKTYPDGTRALDAVSLRVSPGLFGLLGPNGAGKSTLMRTLATLQEPDSGSIHLGELDLVRYKREARERLGYLPQQFGLYPKARCQELLEHFAALKGVVRRRERRALSEELLRRTNLWDARQRPLRSFSGGMKQRFGIAVALVGNPQLLIVDEPTAGLDPVERVRFLNLLAELGEQVVVLLSTHIVADVADLCAELAILSRGRVLLSGEPRAEVERLRGQMWRRSLQRDQLALFEKEHLVLSTRLVHGSLEIRVRAEQRPDPSFESAEPELEDVYFAAIHGHAEAAGEP